jgi:hypothetical protein
LAAGLCPLTLSEPNATITREDKWLERRKFDRFTVFDEQRRSALKLLLP